jgi:hypothetical protein
LSSWSFAPITYAWRGPSNADDAGHAQREEPAVRKCRRRFRSGSVTRGAGFILNGVGSRLPDGLAGFSIQRAHHFVFVLTRERVDAVRDHDRVATCPDFDLPSACRSRPGGRRGERGKRAVAVRATPLWPVRAGGAVLWSTTRPPPSGLKSATGSEAEGRVSRSHT